ncbi:MAG: AI-2E family transporter, partial [Candidatus Methylomirabilales bacterium]
EAFEAALPGGRVSPEEREKRQLARFRSDEERKFARDFRASKVWDFLQLDNIKKFIGGWLPDFTQWIASVGVGIFQLTVQFGLSLLLSFFITFDLPRLRRGLQRLETSRISDFYQEIAPGLASFGKLIGRAFQAQGVIALCNTLLTFAAIKMLGIQQEVVLSAVVFICSFIPVVGVVISSVPIAVIAIIQPEGNFWLAIYAVLAILAIHFIETSILNPKIMGDMLHLHPVMVLGILAVGEYFFHVWGLLLGVPVAVYIIRHVILAENGQPEPGGGVRPEPPREAPAPPVAAAGLKR